MDNRGRNAKLVTYLRRKGKTAELGKLKKFISFIKLLPEGFEVKNMARVFVERMREFMNANALPYNSNFINLCLLLAWLKSCLDINVIPIAADVNYFVVEFEFLYKRFTMHVDNTQQRIRCINETDDITVSIGMEQFNVELDAAGGPVFEQFNCAKANAMIAKFYANFYTGMFKPYEAGQNA